MTTDIPTISITTQNDTEEIYDTNNYCNDSNIKDVLTDVEDLDSNDENVNFVSLKQTLQVTSKKNSPAVTDIEDYHDSGSEDEISRVIPEVQVSLQEYLDHGFTEEKTHLSNEITSKCGSKFIEGNFQYNLSTGLEDPGCITDCENVDTSDDDNGQYTELTKVADSHNESATNHENFNSENHISTEIQNENEKQNEDNVNEEEGACCLSSILSEAEDITVSEEDYDFENDEDENQNHKYPVIDITFVPERQYYKKRKISDCSSTYSPYPDASENLDDPLTDVERLGSDGLSSDESDVSSSDPIPRARASIASITDIEDLDISNAVDLSSEINQEVNNKSLPAPVREMVIVKEDNCGDPVVKIMPLTENIQYLSIDTFCIDKGLTDVEDISDIDDDVYRLIDAPTVEIPIIENAVVQNCENIKLTTHQRKNEFIDKEPVTETEEFFVAGTVRRKKTKTKSQSNKNKSKFLDVTRNVEQVATDIEEIEVSDFESRKNTNEYDKTNKNNITNSPEQITDLEYFTGEDDNCISDSELLKSEGITSYQENFYSSVSTTEGLIKQGDKIHRRPSPTVQHYQIFECESNSLCQTDIEDIQLSSDVDDNLLNISYSRADTISPIEIREVFNDSVSVVHEKCSNVFNVDKEKNFIKGLKDCCETFTDVEYLDEDIDVGGKDKKHCIIKMAEGEEAPVEPKPDDEKK